MKKCIGLILALCSLAAVAQQPSVNQEPSLLFKEGYQYQTGMGKALSPSKALQLFKQASALGDVHAMNALGNVYSFQSGGHTNIDSSIFWYSLAGKKGYGTAYFNLGEIYRHGSGVPQDFSTAADYYERGAALGNKDCSNAIAYFYYKGLGRPQDYNIAFQLYSQLADSGEVNAMYFTGLCYRNGYGTLPNSNLAKQWLFKAASLNDWQAIHELAAEPIPENRSVLSSDLQDQVSNLRSYQERMQADPTNDISGTYFGHAIYYDFSGKYVHDIVPLSLTIVKNGNSYQGSWKEGDSLIAPINGTFDNNMFLFDSSSVYVRHNYYSYEAADKYLFNNASLKIKYLNDSIYLVGDINFYSLTRKEPGQPMFISLAQKATPSAELLNSKLLLSVYPNPSQSTVNAEFMIGQSTKISLKITSQDGKSLEAVPEETLPPGSYNYSFNIKNLSAGGYFLILYAGNKVEHQLFVKF